MFNEEIIDKIIVAMLSVVIAVAAYYIVKQAVTTILRRPKARLTEKQAQRVETLQSMIINIMKYVIIIATGLAVVASFGVDVSSLLAGLGIGAAVVGLALKDLAQDVIAGISIITEAQYEVGDLIEVNGFRGRVTHLGLKTTRVKNYRGKELIISNRHMDKLVNYSTHDTLAEAEFFVAYESDLKKVDKVLQEVKKELDGSMEQMTGEIKIFGPTKLDESGIKYKLSCACKPYKHFAVQRTMRRAVKEALEKNNIKIPYPQVEVHTGKKAD